MVQIPISLHMAGKRDTRKVGLEMWLSGRHVQAPGLDGIGVGGDGN